MEILTLNEIPKPEQIEDIALHSPSNNIAILSDNSLRSKIYNGSSILVKAGLPNSRYQSALANVIDTDLEELTQAGVREIIYNVRMLCNMLAEDTRKLRMVEARRTCLVNAIEGCEMLWTSRKSRMLDHLRQKLSVSQRREAIKLLACEPGEETPLGLCMTTQPEMPSQTAVLVSRFPRFEPQHFVSGKMLESGMVRIFVQIMHNPEANGGIENVIGNESPIDTYRVYGFMHIAKARIDTVLKSETATRVQAEIQAKAIDLKNERGWYWRDDCGTTHFWYRIVIKASDQASAERTLDVVWDQLKALNNIAVTAISSCTENDVSVTEMISEEALENEFRGMNMQQLEDLEKECESPLPFEGNVTNITVHWDDEDEDDEDEDDDDLNGGWEEDEEEDEEEI